MLNSSIVINDTKDLKQIDKRIYILLMKLGFSNKFTGTFYFRKLIIIRYLNSDVDLTYSKALDILCNELNKNKYTVRSLITNSFINLNKRKYIDVFTSIFDYSIDYNSITPLNLYESFAAYFQLY